MSLINEWSAKNPVINFDEDDNDDNHANEAFFSNELLKDNMIGYYTLIDQTLKEKEDFYSIFILPNSPANASAKKMIDNYSSKTKQFKSIKYNVTGITIGKDSSTVNVRTVVTYVDVATKKQQTITENVTYTIVIDEFGQYMIKSIVINDAVDSGAKDVLVPPVQVDPTDEEDPADTNGTEGKTPAEDKESVEDADANTNGEVSPPQDEETPKKTEDKKIENER